MTKNVLAYLGILLLAGAESKAQLVPVGNWQSHLPYGDVVSVADAGYQTYFSNGLGLFMVDKWFNSVELYNKINGLSDMGIRRIRYSRERQRLIIAYENGNIDVLDKGGGVKNFPAIRNNNSILGDKSINHIFCDGNLVYFSCDFGLTVLDLQLREFVKTTFTPMHKALACTRLGDTLFLSTDKGIYKASMQVNLLDFQNWVRQTPADGIPTNNYRSRGIAALHGRVFADVNDTVMVYAGQGVWEHYLCTEAVTGQVRPKLFTEATPITDLTVDFDKNLLFVVHGATKEMTIEVDVRTDTYTDLDIFYGFGIADITKDSVGDRWIASARRGAWRQGGLGWTEFSPQGPKAAIATDMTVDKNGNLWTTTARYGTPTFSRQGSSKMSDYASWTQYNEENFPVLEDFLDHQRVAVHPGNGKTYIGSMLHGLLEIDTDNQMRIFDQNTPGCSLQGVIGDAQRTRVFGLAFDGNNDLWISNHAALRPISVLRNDGTWRNFATPFSNQVGDMAIDRNGYKWIVQTSGNLLVFDSGVLDDDTDNRYYLMTTANELGSDGVNCVAADRDAGVWVGTRAGVTIFNCPNNLFDSGCKGLRPVVNPDNFNGRLLETENVRTIAVDGGNRKWVGTESGVFVLSPDGYEQIYFFNADNSPLFDNRIIKIAIDGQTGTVYIATEKGIQSFRGQATQAELTMSRKSVHVYPNPVRPDYNGLIAIDDLTEDAQVKITDVSGKLVYQTRALGGQATWDGNDYKGKRAASGMYLVFAVSDDGEHKMVAKLAFLP